MSPRPAEAAPKPAGTPVARSAGVIRPTSRGASRHRGRAGRPPRPPQPQRTASYGKKRHEVSIPRLDRQLYAHGGFMALTRSFLEDRLWSGLCKRLTPDAWARAATVGGADWTDPLQAVMAILENNPVLAAYGTQRAASRGVAPPIEWDVWLDPHQPGNLHLARIIHGNHMAESLASGRDPRALLLTRVSTEGSDVHLGSTAAAWLDAFMAAGREAARASGRPVVLTPPALYLDVKSTYSTPADINAFIASVADWGVPVRGVGSFQLEQLPGLAVQDRLHLFDTPDDVVSAAAAGHLARGAQAMCNGGCLLVPAPDGDWQIDPDSLEALRTAWGRHGVATCFYIQETAADPRALSAIIRCVNENKDVFPLGLAYGGLNGLAEAAVPPGRGAQMVFAGSVA
jgi:hypothetical protein